MLWGSSAGLFRHRMHKKTRRILTLAWRISFLARTEVPLPETFFADGLTWEEYGGILFMELARIAWFTEIHPELVLV